MKTGSYFCAILLIFCSAGLCPIFASTSGTYDTFSAKQNSMSIDPKMRAFDYKEAFEMLRKEKAPSKVCVNLISGSFIANIIDMQLMGNSTVFLVKYNTPQGIKLQAIELEMIQGISYLE